MFAAENDGATAGVAEWARANEHELERLYKEVGAQGSIVMVAGVEKRLVDLNSLNDRFALLQTRRAAAVYISRHDYMPIKEDDFRRRVANEVVQIGVDKTGKPVFEGAYKFWTGHARRHVFQRMPSPGKNALTIRSTCSAASASLPRRGIARSFATTFTRSSAPATRPPTSACST